MGLAQQFTGIDGFFKFSNGDPVETIEYIKDYLRQNPESKIYVGCDSQTRGPVTTYVSTIVFHQINKGCHVLYNKKKMPKVVSIWQKLWHEVEWATQLGEYLLQHDIRVESVNLDLSSTPGRASNPILNSAIGYVKAHGLNYMCKPNVLPAISAADNLSK